ncbi:MAG: adenosylcobinamide-GDP ribazoletransferase [Methylobacillus sp.]|jgi:adenosylcobinamide-GDP ribazoletransferase|nr:adenosylcobinamide-GDP ribazoletransferase [Methylobacillus sp.]
MMCELRLFFTALMFFTRIPCGRFAGTTQDDLDGSSRYFPWIGILVGAVGAGIYWVADQFLPQEIAVLLSMAATILLTGAFHEDGLADAADGLGGGWEKEQVLAIMQDSRLGSYGALAIFMALLVKFETLAHLSPALLPLVLIAGHALSRFCALLVMVTQDYVRPNGKAKPLATQLSKGGLLVAAVGGLAPLAVFWHAPHLLWALVPVVLTWLWFARKLKRRLGGYTGDCLGAMQQLCELAFYLGILALSI